LRKYSITIAGYSREPITKVSENIVNSACEKSTSTFRWVRVGY